MMSSALLDLEHLQQISYERSKIWSTYLDNVASIETSAEIDLDDLDEVFGTKFHNQKDEDDELASMDDDECDDFRIDSEILKNANNNTRFSLLFNSISLTVPESTDRINDQNHEYADLFNRTLPIITEHHRQLKESGFDRILNTFDKNKIEETVGSWLNRHNTLYGGDATLISADKTVQRYPKSNRDNSRRKEDATSDSDDTLHSGETARYIRSSRVNAMKNASSASATTMIKTYRMVKSNREALREKYSFEQEDDETHLKAIRHRRRIAATEIEYNHYEHGRSQRSHKHETYISPSKHLQKRKVLRKRNTYSTRDNSSDSDSYYCDKDDRGYRKKKECCSKHCTPAHATFPHSNRKSIKMPCGRSNRNCYYSHSKSISSSSSSASFSANYEKRQLIKRNKFYNDSRPCRRESECRCCNDRKLCQDYIHVADISTEEWFVENCFSSKKLSKTPSSNKHKPVTLEPATLDPELLPNLKKNIRPKKTTVKPLKQTKTAQEVKKDKEKSKATTKTNNKKVSPTLSDDTFNVELQMAIEASKKQYEQENITKNQQTEIKEQHKTRVTKPLRKLPRRATVEDDVTDVTPEQLKKNPKKHSSNSYAYISDDDTNNNKEPQLIRLVHYSNDVITAKDLTVGAIFVKPQPRSLSKAKKTKSSAITSSEETFFAPTQTQVICNSTAMPNDTQAYNRQFTEHVAERPSNKLVRKKVANIEGTDIDSKETTVEIKTNRKRQTTIIKAKDDERSLLKKVIKKPRNVHSDNEKTCVSKNTSNCQITASPTTSTNTTQNCDSPSKIATSTVTSTTIRSPDTNCTNAQNILKQTIVDFDSSLDEHSDCTLVTSTTNIDPPKPASVTVHSLEQQQPQLSSTLTSKGILIYTPQNHSLVPAHSLSNDGGYFTINKDHLSSIIGEKQADKFLKYYIGRRRFNSNSTIYFKPPSMGKLATNFSSSSESDDDLESLGQYGDLYESFDKTTNSNKHGE